MLASKQSPGNAAVTVIHSRVKNPGDFIRQADIFISSVGKPAIWNRDHISPGTVVIDVGINVTPDGKLVGDVDFEEVKEIAGAITPVPGGVGPMTVAMLLRNTLTLFLKRMETG
jgi:methylenetetrahydrofolate dehydrogenase (NADP+)/methenyltetrahydrofolate cyclohydrolase